MIRIDSTEEELDRRLTQFCAPLWATGLYLAGGHTAESINATITFVQFEGRVYGVTCHHVLSAFFSECVRRNLRMVPTIFSGVVVHQLGGCDQNGTYNWHFVSCRSFPEQAEVNDEQALAELDRKNASLPDIAIVDLSDYWEALQEFRSAQAIDLDAWSTPDWDNWQATWLAFGYPDGHKEHVENKVSVPLLRVAAKLQTGFPTEDKPTVTLCSTLEEDHGFGFSGLSGGPMMVAHRADDAFAFAGITFEGAPSSKDLAVNPEAFVTGADILLMGYHLTPSNFRHWLQQRKYSVAHGPAST